MGALKYRIASQPQYQTVSPGAEVDYWCEQLYDTIEAADGPRDGFQWYCLNDPQAVAERGLPWVVRGSAMQKWAKARWDTAGRHHVQCHVRFTDGAQHVYEQVQCVDQVDAILSRELERARREGTNSPDSAHSATQRYVQLLRDIEVQYPIRDAGKKKQHDDLIAGYGAYLSKLEELLAWTKLGPRYPIHAVHLATQTQERTTLNVFVSRVNAGAFGQQWRLVDWTNPLDRTRTSRHEGSGATAWEAIAAAIDAWASGGNRYASGRLEYAVPGNVAPGEPLAGAFDTSGSTTWDKLATGLEWIGIAAAGVAFVVGIVAPVPGSSLLSAAIWTSVFSSTAAATINIGQRHEEGFGDWRDDAFDTLTIVGNLFAGASMWAKGATVLARNAEGKLLRATLIGQVGTDAVQGVLIGVEHLKAFDEIMNAPDLMPDERAHKLLELFRSLAVAGVLTYVSVKGTKADLENLGSKAKHLAGEEARAPKEKLKDLADPKKTVDITKVPPAETHTNDEKLTVTAQTAQRRSAGQERAKSPFESKFLESDDWVNFKISDNLIWLEHVRSGQGNDPKMNWIFRAELKKGAVEIKVRVRGRDGAGNPSQSDRLRGRECYEMMFEHFEAKGRRIEAWKGEFAWDNYRAVKQAIASGATPKEAILQSVTAKFWREWAERKGLRAEVLQAEEIEGEEFAFFVKFVPK